jgi:DNA-binding HxlR family transcriptional regulator
LKNKTSKHQSANGALLKKRSYGDACAAAHALDLVGERWTLLVMRELLLGPKRFMDLRASLPGISANVLTQRLDELEALGIVERRKLPPPASAWVYGLTEWGLESEELFKVIGRWGARSPYHDPTLPLSVSSLVMSMRTMFAPARAKGVKGTIGFRFGAEEFVARLGDGALAIRRSAIADADVDAAIEGDARDWAAVLYGGAPLRAMEKSGRLKASGDRALIERYITLFPLPPKAGGGESGKG